MTRAQIIRCACRVLNPMATLDLLADLRAEMARWDVAYWQLLMPMLDQAALLPAWGARLNDLGWGDVMPHDVAEASEAAMILNRMRNQQILGEARQLSSRLEQAGCPHVYLKGAAHLMAGLYPDPAYRLASDLDVLVPEGQARQAYRALQEDGYQFKAVVDYDSPDGGALTSKHHLTALQHPQRLVMVELHTRFVSDGQWPRSPDIFAARRPVDQLPNAFVLDPMMSAGQAILHNEARRKLALGHIHLKDALDVLTLLSQTPLSVPLLRRTMSAVGRCREAERFLAQAAWFFGPLEEGGSGHPVGLRDRLGAEIKSRALCSPVVARGSPRPH